MRLHLLIATGTGSPRAVTLDAAPDTTFDAVGRALAAALPGAPDGPIYLGQRPLPASQRLGDGDLAAGMLVGLGRPATEAAQPGGGWLAGAQLEAAVVGGLAAGASVPAPPGAELRIGRGQVIGLAIDDTEVSRDHARLHIDGVDGDGAVLRDAGSRNGTRWAGYRLVGEARLTDGDVFQVGESAVALRRPPTMVERLEHDPASGRLAFNRPPRITAPPELPELAVPTEPEAPRAGRFPLAAVLLPLLLGAGLLLFGLSGGSSSYLLLIVLSPLTLLVGAVGDRLSGRKEYRGKKARYQSELAEHGRRLAGLVRAEEQATRVALADPAAVVAAATGPTARLWERRPVDVDFLRLRVGLTDRPSAVRLRRDGHLEAEPPLVRAVPVAVDLPAAGVIGLAAPAAARLGLARWLVAQAAALHVPGDLGLVVLTGIDEADDWAWCGWLPHAEPHRADWPARAMVAVDAHQAEARLAELRRLIEERHSERRSHLRAGPPSGRRLLVVLDGARRLRHLRGLPDVLRDGPAAGVYALCLDTDERDLPDECGATVVATNPAGTRVQVRLPHGGAGGDLAGGTIDDVLVDGLPAPLADRLARTLAPIRVLGGAGELADGGVPDVVRLLEVLRTTDLAAADVRAAWEASPDGRSTTVVLGVGADGPVEVDLSRDGPHALVAGTSGAGKSELLQTLVASLALGNTPDALTFVLVDYKGGSAFKECKDLPHCIGLVTDLDGHLAERALASLGAELKRREQLLASAGAKDIQDYWARSHARLPRLVIVIDEFATLVEEVPGFVNGIVGIGMRGRSLGVHVVLATQRPAGVVSADIRANVNLRLCLRVTSDADSADVIDTTDAARISKHTPGRAYLRTGHSELTQLQTARVGWPRQERAAADAAPVVAAWPRRFAELGEAPSAAPDDSAPASQPEQTDLSRVVRAVSEAAADLGVSAPPSPWLPPLPPLVSLAALDTGPEPAAGPAAGRSPIAVIGLADRPARQAQTPFVLDLERTGSLLVAGAVRSGRSTVLRTVAAALAARAGTGDLHLYALDCGNRALAPLAALPHCGAVVDGDDSERTGRLLAMLAAEVTRRQRLLAQGGFGSLAEQRSANPEGALPYVVVLVDRMEAFHARYVELDGGRLLDQFDHLLRQGPAVGLVFVVASDRVGITQRLLSAVEARLVLRQADRDDFALVGVDPRPLPTVMPPGRAVWGPTGEQVQIAVLGADPAGAAQAEAVRALAGSLRGPADSPARMLPRRVDPLPERITLAEAERLRATSRPEGAAACVIGAGGDHLGPVDVDLAQAGGCFVVAGPPRSGRSTALAAIVSSLNGRATGALPILVVAPRPSPLRDLRGQPGIIDVLDRAEGLDEDLAAGLEAVASARPGGPFAVVVDDAELVADPVAARRLEQVVRLTRDGAVVLVAAGATQDMLLSRYHGWVANARRARTGLLLNPVTNADGEIFDLRLPRSVGGGWPAGRGLLVTGGAMQPVQVPLP